MLPLTVVVADFNGGGRPDLAGTAVGTNNVSVLLNATPAGASSAACIPQQVFAAGPRLSAVAMGDFNGDGRADLAGADCDNCTVAVLADTSAAGTVPDPAVVGQFAGTGVWGYNRTSGTWAQLAGANADSPASAPNGNVAASFGGNGV